MPGRFALQCWPLIAVVAGFVVPFGLLLQVSVAHREAQGLWHAGFEFDNFVAVLNRNVLGRLAYTASLALLVGLVSLALGFPLAACIARMGRRSQLAWLILLLSTLSLSEVLVAFSWQVMLARRIGLSDLLVFLGLLDEPQSLYPTFGAVLAGIVYLVLPVTVTLLFPGVSRLDGEFAEAARMMGARPLQVLTTVTLPMLRAPLISAFLLSVVLAMGTYVMPLVLGHPSEWTFAILIGQAALSEGNLPQAAAMSLLLLAASLTLTLATLLLGRRGRG